MGKVIVKKDNPHHCFACLELNNGDGTAQRADTSKFSGGASGAGRYCHDRPARST
jgi:hypothetical protein